MLAVAHEVLVRPPPPVRAISVPVVSKNFTVTWFCDAVAVPVL